MFENQLLVLGRGGAPGSPEALCELCQHGIENLRKSVDHTQRRLTSSTCSARGISSSSSTLPARLSLDIFLKSAGKKSLRLDRLLSHDELGGEVGLVGVVASASKYASISSTVHLRYGPILGSFGRRSLTFTLTFLGLSSRTVTRGLTGRPYQLSSGVKIYPSGVS